MHHRPVTRSVSIDVVRDSGFWHVSSSIREDNGEPEQYREGEAFRDEAEAVRAAEDMARSAVSWLDEADVAQVWVEGDDDGPHLIVRREEPLGSAKGRFAAPADFLTPAAPRASGPHEHCAPAGMCWPHYHDPSVPPCR